MHEIGVAQHVSRFDQVLHLKHFSVDGGILCRQPIEGAAELQPAIQVWWALPFGRGMSEIRDRRRRPGRFDEAACFAEKSLRKPGDRVSCPAQEQSAKQ